MDCAASTLCALAAATVALGCSDSIASSVGESCLDRLHPGSNYDATPAIPVKIWIGTDAFDACGIDLARGTPHVCRVPPGPVAYTIDPRTTQRIVVPWHIYTNASGKTFARALVRARSLVADMTGSGDWKAVESRLYLSMCGTDLPMTATRAVSNDAECGWAVRQEAWHAPSDAPKATPRQPGAIDDVLQHIAKVPCDSFDDAGACLWKNPCGNGSSRITIVAQVRLPDGRWGQDAVSFEAVPDGPPPLHLSGIPSPTTP
jgi:hypothetical protein